MKLRKLNKGAGSKPMYGEKMILTAFYARPEQLVWLRARPQGIARTVRDLVDKAMAEESVTIPDYNT